MCLLNMIGDCSVQRPGIPNEALMAFNHHVCHAKDITDCVDSDKKGQATSGTVYNIDFSGQAGRLSFEMARCRGDQLRSSAHQPSL